MRVIFTKGNITDRWSWTLYATNGRVVAHAPSAMHGYTRKSDCIKAFRKIREVDYIQGVVEDSKGQPKACYGF